MRLTIRLLIPLLLLSAALGAFADDFADVKETIRLRAPDVQELKARGLLREGAKGLLEPASAEITLPQRNILELENADRKRMFPLIAQRSQSTPEDVARVFEQMAASRAKPQMTLTKVPSTTPLPASPLPSTADSRTPRPVPNDRSPALPLRILTRPQSNIYASDDKESPKVWENVPRFTIFSVYDRGGGWYEVGKDDRGTKLGWMREADVVEWKQNLVVEFSHPDGRKPVLMFDKKEDLADIAEAPKGRRVERAQYLYDTIDSGKIPSDFPVRTMEPKRYVQSSGTQFYRLPIVDFDESEMDGREGRLLQIASATLSRGSGFLTDDRYRDEIVREPNPIKARKVKVDFVFVMDLTKSMGPFVDSTLDMIKGCLNRLSTDAETVEAVRFGFWGYRDFPENCPGIEFNTKNYTRELQGLSEFARTLQSVKATEIDSVDYPEDVFAGVEDAVEKTPWRGNALRFIVLVGDAPGRGPQEVDPACTDPNRPIGTRSGLNEESLRRRLDERDVYVSALYLKVPKWERYEAAGERQFRTIAQNKNVHSGPGNFQMLNARDTSVYGKSGNGIADEILKLVKDAQAGGHSYKEPLPEPPGGVNVDTEEGAEDASRYLARNMFRGAMLEWLDSEDKATVPTDVKVWASDKDLVDPAIQALAVKVVLNKNELNSLKLAVHDVISGGLKSQLSGEKFFDALQKVAAAAANSPGDINTNGTLADSGLVPHFLKGLPYLSKMMAMSNAEWRSMGPDAQREFLNDLHSKVSYYQMAYDDLDRWEPLNEEDEGNRDKWVTAIPLAQLP